MRFFAGVCPFFCGRFAAICGRFLFLGVCGNLRAFASKTGSMPRMTRNSLTFESPGTFYLLESGKNLRFLNSTTGFRHLRDSPFLITQHDRILPELFNLWGHDMSFPTWRLPCVPVIAVQIDLNTSSRPKNRLHIKIEKHSTS